MMPRLLGGGWLEGGGISSYKLARSLGVTQATSWFIMHGFEWRCSKGHELGVVSEVEADGTYISGAARNMHKDKQVDALKTESYFRKTVVMGMVELDREMRPRCLISPQRKC